MSWRTLIETMKIKNLLDTLIKGTAEHNDIRAALSLTGKAQEDLFALARAKRSERFPLEKAEIRSVIELSNICCQKCRYCGIYRQSEKFIIKTDRFRHITEHLYSLSRRVLLLQSGENPSQDYIDFVSEELTALKRSFPDLTVVLCLGSLSYEQYSQLRHSGADRYILKFETSNQKLYAEIKVNDTLENRLRSLKYLIELGFSVGTGNIVGLPGQTLDDLVNDLLLIEKFKLTMASSSVFIPNKGSEYRDEPAGDIDLTLNFMALIRIYYPELLIPTTSSLEKMRPGGQLQGLMAGANAVTIHDGTPEDLKKRFPIYTYDRFTPDETHIRSIIKEAGLKL